MKYILLMSGTKPGVETYHALAEPREAKVVRGEKNGLPVTDGIFPESKEFLLGYWIVEVATPERAYAIAGRISAAPGPGGVPTNMPIEVRQFAVYEPKSQ